VRARPYLVLKRCIDLALCIIALPVLLIVVLVIVIAIRIDSPGPALFYQLRTGRHGTRFRMFKFRTMVRNAEELKASLAYLSIVAPPDFKVIDDPRITRVGRFLRRTSLDELPQVLNILRGEMSLVGPRPTSFSSDTYALWHTRRLEVRPGVTGLWQVRGRNHMSFDERLRLDVQYIDHMCLPLDVEILFATLAAVVKRSGA
jgi:lipopolysaccharide/colanic/teichoic acid biosynthesis glycosyltransferase